VAVTAPAPVPAPAPMPKPAPPLPAPRAPRPETVEPPRPEPPTPRPPEPRPEPPTPGEPTPAPDPKPTPRPEPPKREDPAPTKVTRAVAILREIEGSFDLVDKPLRGKQKDLPVTAGDRLRATAAVRITLADDRVVLLAPRTVIEFRPEEKRLALAMEQGDLIADLIGPGPEIRVTTRACEITPLGTVFGVKVDAGRTMVTVEKGRVEVQSPKGKATLKPAEAIQASEDGTIGAPVPADFRSMAWARSQRAPELTLFADDFSAPGAWVGAVAGGVARAVARPGGGATLHLAVDKGMFEVPVRGSITIVCRSDRAGKFKVQLYSPDQKTTYTKQNISILRGDTWRTVVVDFDELVPSDKAKPARLPAGSVVADLLIMYGDEGERGNFWVDSIKVTEVRP
jgi:FecR protein